MWGTLKELVAASIRTLSDLLNEYCILLSFEAQVLRYVLLIYIWRESYQSSCFVYID